jgi:hypothetical protein
METAATAKAAPANARVRGDDDADANDEADEGDDEADSDDDVSGEADGADHDSRSSSRNSGSSIRHLLRRPSSLRWCVVWWWGGAEG